MKRKWMVILLAVFIFSSCSTINPPGSFPPDRDKTESALRVDATASIPDEISARVDNLLAQMTLDEKIGQMTQVEKNSLDKGDIKKYFLGSVLNGGGDAPYPNSAESWKKMIDGFQDEALATRLAIPIVYGLDAVHGFGALYGATIFPQAIGLGATRDAELVRQVGQTTAEEMLATGARWNFAPIVAVPQDIRWGRTYESYSENTELVSELSTAFISGLQTLPQSFSPTSGQSIYVLSTPKHILGDGGTTYGTSKMFLEQFYLLDQGDMLYSEEEIRTLFLPPYQAAIEAGAKSVMVSFSSWNGVKMHAQKYWITDVLKGELNFKGIVISDWGGIYQVASDNYTSVVTSINAGIDMNMVPYDYKGFISDMKRAVQKGDISIERIDDAVRRILTVKFELGLFDHPYAYAEFQDGVGSQEHRGLARKAVSESLVLLKNEKSTLPINKDVSTIYVAGVASDDMGIQCGGWTTKWQGEAGGVQPGTTLLEGIRQTVSASTIVEYNAIGDFNGVAYYGIAVVGEYPYAEGVGDKSDLSLSGYDIQVIENLREHSKKLVVVILSGRPMIITNQYLLADAWVAAWLPGTEGQGVSDVLFGELPFTGKLPYTWPRFNKQLPVNSNNSAKLKGCEAPLFPYGFGLGEAGSSPIKWRECVEED